MVDGRLYGLFERWIVPWGIDFCLDYWSRMEMAFLGTLPLTSTIRCNQVGGQEHFY
jgi:hypothetical protein